MAVDTAVIRVQLDTKDVKRGVKKISDMFGRIQRNSAQRLVRAVANIASIHMFARMTSEAKEFERTMSLISGRLGMTTDHIANMQMAFNRFNKSGSGVQKLLGSIAQGVSAVKFGDGKFVSKLAAMGIRYRTASGGTKSNEQIMYDIADWTKSQLARGRSEQDLRYLLQSTFGIDDATFEALKGGSAKMRKIQKEYQEATGGIKTENTTRLRKALDRLSNTFDTLKKKIVENLAPTIEWFADKLEKLGGFLTKHDEFSSIIAGIIALLSTLTTLKWIVSLGSLFSGIGVAAGGAASAVGLLVSSLGYLSIIIAGIIAAIGAWELGKSLGESFGDWLSKTFGSGDRTTEEFWDNAVKEGKMTWQTAEFGKEQFVPGYKNKPKITKAQPFVTEHIADEKTRKLFEEERNINRQKIIEEYKNRTQPVGDFEDIPMPFAIEQVHGSDGVYFQNDIDVEVNVDKNGGVETNINSNGQTNNGQFNQVSYTGKAA